MLNKLNKMKLNKGFLTSIGCATIVSVGLSGCMVSENPYVNTAATTAAIGVASLLFYSMNDGYYYDDNYRRLPRDYRPSQNARIQRIQNMNEYRQQHPLQQRQNPRNQRNPHNPNFSDMPDRGWRYGE